MATKETLTDKQLIDKWKRTGLLEDINVSDWVEFAKLLDEIARVIVATYEHTQISEKDEHLLQEAISMYSVVYKRGYKIKAKEFINNWRLFYTVSDYVFQDVCTCWSPRLEPTTEEILSHSFIEKYYPDQSMTLQESNDIILKNMKNS